VQFRVLGPLEVVADDGTPVGLGGTKQRAVLALLVAEAGRAVSVDRIVDQVWGGDPPDKAMGSLQVYVANLRRLLEPGRAPRTPSRVLVTRPPGYALAVGPDAVDALAFESAVARARELLPTDPTTARELLDSALALWRGDAYADVAAVGPALTAEATRLDTSRLDALEDRWRAVLACGDHRGAVPELEALVAAHPLREGLWGLLALALYRSQRQADALETMRRARRLLADELGLDPGPQLRALEEALLRQDPALAPPTRPAPTTPAPRPPAAEAPSPPATTPGPVLTEEDAGTDLVGRDRALTAVRQLLPSVRQGQGAVVLVSGEPGIGKTRLAEALLAEVAAIGFRCGAGRADEESGGPASAPWVQAVTGLVGDDGIRPPGLDQLLGHEPATSGSTDADSAAYRTAEGLAAALRSLGAQQPVCLVLDDLHWADPDTLRVLRRLAPRVRTLPLLLVLTTREAEAEIGDDLRDTLALLARLDPLRLRLGGLSETDVVRLVAARHGEEVSPRVASAIRARTEGNPFYVGELVRLLVSEGAIGDPAAVSRLDVPDGVRDVVRRRLARLPEDAGAFLLTASVVGRTFEPDVVQAAAGLGDDAADDGVDAAVLAGLVTGDGPGRFRFAHALVREAVYARVPAQRLARLHGRVARALETLRPGEQEARAGEVARHHLAAGPGHARRACEHAVVAATQAVGAAERERSWEVAVEAARRDPTVEPSRMVELLTALGTARRESGHVQRAWAPLGEAARTAVALGDPVAAAGAVVEISTGAVWTWRTYPTVDDEAIALIERLLDAIPAEEGRLRARLLATLAVELLYAAGGRDRREALATRAVELGEQNGDPAELFQLLLLQHLVLWRPGRLAERLQVVERLTAMAEAGGDALAIGTVLLLRASDRFEAADLPGGLADLDRSQELAARVGSVPLLVIGAWAQAVFPVCRGDFAEAERLVHRAEELHAGSSIAGLEALPIAHRTTQRLLQGRLDELGPALSQVAASGLAAWRDGAAMALVHGGRLQEARALLGPWSGRLPLPDDFVWLPAELIRARLWSVLGDPDALEALEAELHPYRERLGYGGSGVMCTGLVVDVCGVLAFARGDVDRAVADLEEAVAWYDDAGFRACHVRAARVLAEALRRRDGPGDGHRAEALAGAATAEAERLGIRLEAEPVWARPRPAAPKPT
jgi:DNA-binding SARP family transcriptional activator/tetratricopeptide (TPR) repeat protein